MTGSSVWLLIPLICFDSVMDEQRLFGAPNSVIRR